MLPVVSEGDNDDRNLIILCCDCHHQTTNYFNTKLINIKKDEIEVSKCQKENPIYSFTKRNFGVIWCNFFILVQLMEYKKPQSIAAANYYSKESLSILTSSSLVLGLYLKQTASTFRPLFKYSTSTKMSVNLFMSEIAGSSI